MSIETELAQITLEEVLRRELPNLKRRASRRVLKTCREEYEASLIYVLRTNGYSSEFIQLVLDKRSYEYIAAQIVEGHTAIKREAQTYDTKADGS